MTRQELINEIEKLNPEIMMVVDQKSTDKLHEIYQAMKYPQRRIDGQRFSDMQGAKLVILEASDVVKKAVSDFFAPSQNFFSSRMVEIGLKRFTNQKTKCLCQC